MNALLRCFSCRGGDFSIFLSEEILNARARSERSERSCAGIDRAFAGFCVWERRPAGELMRSRVHWNIFLLVGWFCRCGIGGNMLLIVMSEIMV